MNIDNIAKIIVRPDVLGWIFIIGILIISKFIFGLNYISVNDIVSNHLNCFRGRKGKILIVPVINYFGIPFLLACMVVLMRIIDDSTINIITIIVSIITAMLFTLLTVVIDMKAKIKENPEYFSKEAEVSNKALVETYYTIMFEILVSVILLVLCLFNAFTKSFTVVISFTIYYLTFVLIVNLLMIMKRIFKVIDLDMKK